MEVLIAFLNTVAICVLFIYIVILVIRHASAQIQVSQLDYWIYRPLFPFVLAEEDPLSVIMPYRDTVSSEANH